MVVGDVQAPSDTASSVGLAVDGRYDGSSPTTDPSHTDPQPLSIATEVAFAALSTLPTPLLVLSSRKTVLLANSAVGRLLGVHQDESQRTATDLLKGQALSQIGIDMISNGVPIWVEWDKFLDNLADGLSTRDSRSSTAELVPGIQSGDTTPTGPPDPTRGRSSLRNRTQKCPDTVLDVVISARNGGSTHHNQPQRQNKTRSDRLGAKCRMIVSIWTLDGQRFFTLTFTSLLTQSLHKQGARSEAIPRNPSSNSTRSSHSSHSVIFSSANGTSQVTTPGEHAAGMAFPPTSAPASCAVSSTITDFHKVLKMKNAMLSAIEIPLIAMWKDESVVHPNSAARRLLAVKTNPTSGEAYDFVSRFRPWSADFSRQLEEHENPIVALCRTQKAFTSWQIGLVNDQTGDKSIFDVSGHPVFDEKSGEFLAGLIAFKDVTLYADKIALQIAEKEEQFRLICDMMPQMCWTTTADGYHDYFSKRWYDYTGLTPPESLGYGWKLPFHEEDMPDTIRRWTHSLATGEEYRTQYRCRRYDGEWRWMLGRALPFRDSKTGNILKWFGSCTDIQDIVDAKLAGQRDRKNLMALLKHSQMTLWIIDRQEKVTFFEGTFLTNEPLKENMVGRSIYDLLGEYLHPNCISGFKAAVKRTLEGTSDMEECENEVHSRWFRSKMIPLREKRRVNDVEDENYISGVIGIGTEVTQMRQKEQENIQLLANERAAKEASKMKSNFLANMSHEIRTPIAGVLGMSDLLMDTVLDEEQSDFAQNIQRSANSLLTVINDILDFSKIESGRLDIEEVQFSLRIVLQDVAKMLSFAAHRKGLDFSSDIQLGNSEDLILLGDPGRVRQILTNLLTNSIKFTSDGYVRMSACIVKDTTDSVTVDFSVEDSGIGIEEDVKKRLFRPFSQADSSTARRFGGTGLGLTICKNLVELMHGTISLESKLDAGTLATFSIPFKKPEYKTNSSPALLNVGMMPDRLQSELSLSMSTPSQEGGRKTRAVSPIKPSSTTSSAAQLSSAISPNPELEAPLSDAQREEYHILVVEDNPVNQQIALRFIRALGFSVRAVWNGKEALEYLLKATSPELTPEQSKAYPIPSLILMDVQMPVLDGYRATHMLRYHAPFTTIPAIRNIPIVAMTASAIHGDREKCERAGMDDYMAKPVKRSLLEQTILKWISPGRSGAGHTAPVANAQSAKILFNRACTDHSSTCTDHDAIVAEFFPESTRQQQEGYLETSAGAEGVAGQGLNHRSNISRRILAREIPGAETESDRATRRAQAEDTARDLRDAKLMSATTGGQARSRLAPTIVLGDSCPFESQAPTASNGYSEDVQESMSPSRLELTEENVSLLNHAQDLDLRPSRTSSPSVEYNDFNVTDIPGPPPEGLLAAADLGGVDANAEALVQVLLERAQHHDEPAYTVTRSDVSGQNLPLTSRRGPGGLAPGTRQSSDWSNSTARPAH
ncbi:hypothetical protein A1O1_05655 [Capronia coronata CBS 617.96]|uniref:Histidine kinase n=1 Tax=Capronia coronata CBS 617.96 TaxID=1182541 RepID=W9Y861_9EURO|nr:uncharacterized protein A1O1_05655 [Capronia coronata CBS 617.96]EXJ88723.1 hypothetical protein A1O1_05655 [Capronia coronata CBS 617.96]